jgi:hypothetical protein
VRRIYAVESAHASPSRGVIWILDHDDVHAPSGDIRAHSPNPALSCRTSTKTRQGGYGGRAGDFTNPVSAHLSSFPQIAAGTVVYRSRGSVSGGEP